MKTLIIMAALLLAGCAGFDAVQRTAAQGGAKAADDVRETAEWTLCQAISVGAWRRAYANDPARAAGWAALCKQANGVPE